MIRDGGWGWDMDDIDQWTSSSFLQSVKAAKWLTQISLGIDLDIANLVLGSLVITGRIIANIQQKLSLPTM